ncbi:MAG: hypothetical protein KBA06_06550, partial [Saprospiraceae bacterium]|nr:hypothetical protein [Saprospiraceae bacterium]
MNSNFFKILSFALPYKKEIFLSIIFNILVVIFSLGSITILVPVLKIMFGTSNKIMQQPVFTGFFKIRDYLDALINYKIYHNIQTYGNAQVLGFVMAVACLMFVLKNFFRYNALVNLGYLKNYIENDIRNALHAKIVSLPISFFSEKRKGDLMARLTTDISEIQWGVLGAVQKGVQDPLMILSTFVMLLIFSPKLTMLVLVLIPLAGVIISRIGSALKKPSFAARNEYSKLMTLIDEHISGLAVIKSYTAEDDVKKRFEENGNKYLYHLNQINRRKELSSPVSETLGSFVIIFVVWYGSYLIMAKNSLQPEMFITYILLLYQIITPAKSLS